MYTITNLNLGTVYEVRVASGGRFGLSGYCCGSGKQVTTYNRECKEYIFGSQILTIQKVACPYIRTYMHSDKVNTYLQL